MAEKVISTYTAKTPESGDQALGVDSSDVTKLLNLGDLAGKDASDLITLTEGLVLSGDTSIRLSGDGTVFEDLRIPVTQTRQGANDLPNFDETNLGYLFDQDDAAEKLYFIVQMPHAWKEESTIYPHIHFKHQAAGTPSFVLTYTWMNIDDAGAAPATAYTMDTLAAGSPANGDHWILQHATNDGIAGTGKTISSILVCTLHRTADSTPDADVLVYEIDFHYEIDSLGSATEYVKEPST
jgi:hypothetical protein